MATPHTFSEDGARRIAAAVKAVENMGTPDAGRDAQALARRSSCSVKLVAVITHPLWSASEVVANGVGGFSDAPYGSRVWDSTTPLLVLGVPEPQLVAGMVLRANCVGTSGGSPYWIAEGYERRVLDWGTGNNASPFIVEDVLGTLTPRIKTKKTNDGYTWTDEKIDMSGKECI